MRGHLIQRVRAAIGLGALAIGGGCASHQAEDRVQPPQYVQDYQHNGFPPIRGKVEYENEHAFPPLVKGRQDVGEMRLDSVAEPRADLAAQVPQLREQALRDGRVTSALGTRYAFVSGGLAPESKGSDAAAAGPLARLMFYSYSRAQAVSVMMRGATVESVASEAKDYQPPETADEIQEAARLVGADPRHGAWVRDLIVRGILTPEDNGHRSLYLLFYRDVEHPAVVDATVDLIDMKVVSVRQISQ